MFTCISYFMQFLYLLSVYIFYILIIIKVRCSRHPQFHPRSKRERKMTGTVPIVSLVSLLCFLPGIIYGVCFHLLGSTYLKYFYIYMIGLVLFLANSLENSTIYALRMPGFREGLIQLVYRVPDYSRIAPTNLPLRNL